MAINGTETLALADQNLLGVEQDLTRDGSLLKKITVLGEGEEAGRGAKVSIRYSLRLADGDNQLPFDSSEKRPNGVLEFTLGRKKVIPALELLAQSMALGEKCEATAAAPYAFGAKGLKRKGVPPNSSIVLSVEMVNFVRGEKSKSMSEMSPDELFEQAKSCKEIGNTLFKEFKYEKAMAQYSQCIRYLANVYYKPSAAEPDANIPPVAKPPSEAPADVSTTNGDVEQPPSEEGFQEAQIVDEDSERKEEEEEKQPDGNQQEDDRESEQKPNGETNGQEQTDAASEQDDEETEQEKSGEVNGTEASEEKNEVNGQEETDESSGPEEKEVMALHIATLNNMSLCFVKLEKHKRAVESASLALKMDAGSAKALYYRGRAQVALGEWEKARRDFVAAQKIQPSNIGIRMEIQKLDKKEKQFAQKERRQAAAMFA